MDIVLSFQPVDQMEECIECLNEDGMMIAVEPVNADTVYKSSAFIFKTIVLEILIERPSIRRHLVEMINADLKRGVIIPLPLKIFRSNELEYAFRFMSTGEQNERIVIAMPNQNEMSKLSVKPRFVADSKSVYIIVGGLGDMGLELVNWMILRGAKTLILCSRRGVSSAYQQYRVRYVIAKNMVRRFYVFDQFQIQTFSSISILHTVFGRCSDARSLAIRPI